MLWVTTKGSSVAKIVKITNCKFKIVNITIFLAIFVLTSCTEKHVEGGEITVRNDILDKDYNSFVVDQVVTTKGAVSYAKELKPNNQVVLPFKHISQLRFYRRYEDHTKVYLVSCPSDFSTAITMKLIDVHTNKLGGGCKLNKRGVMSKGGFVKWD